MSQGLQYFSPVNCSDSMRTVSGMPEVLSKNLNVGSPLFINENRAKTAF